ncbi:MAG TPA: hypothetical protein VFS43_22170 [Polyangiaceae bacterium]|nr:hypothetical protein [Polyangiaceae bacterium]
MTAPDRAPRSPARAPVLAARRPRGAALAFRMLGVAFACFVACGGDDDDDNDGGDLGPDGIPDDVGCVEKGLPCLGCPAGSFCWSHPAPYGGQLLTVSAASETNVWAGSSEDTLLHWNGAEWRVWRIPDGQSVRQVSAAGGGAWVTSTGGLYRFDGQSWSKLELPEAFPGTPQAVAALSTDQAWVGDGTRAAFFDGNAWALSSPGIAGVKAIWAASADEAFAIGTSMKVARFAAGAWSATELAGDPPLSAIGGSSPTNVWVAESDPISGPESVRNLYHWDGTTWTERQGPTSLTPTSIAATNDGGLWVTTGSSDIYSRNGAAFSSSAPLGRPTTPYGFGDEVNAVSMSGPTTGWAVGNGGHLVRFDAAAGWSSFNAPPDEAIGAPVALGPGNVWAPGTRFFHHFDGSAWQQVVPYEGGLFARRIFVESPDSLWSALSNRGIWHYAGGAWSLFNGDEAIDDALEVWAKGSDLWALLEDDSLLRLSGETWAPVAVDISARHLWGTAGGPYVVGVDGSQAGAVRLYDGAAFQPVDFGGGTILGSFGHADGSVWLLVDRARSLTLVRLSPEPKTEQAGPPVALVGAHLWVGSGNDIWVAGADASKPRAFHWDGRAWAEHATPRSGPIASDGTHVFISGGTGLLRLEPGGLASPAPRFATAPPARAATLENEHLLPVPERAGAVAGLAPHAQHLGGVGLGINARHLDRNHADDGVVELGHEVAGYGGLFVRAAHARVAGEKEVAPAGELRRRSHRELGGLVDAARGDGVDVHAALGQRAHRPDHAAGVPVVRGRVGHPEEQLGHAAVAAPLERRRLLERLLGRLGKVAAAVGLLLAEQLPERPQVAVVEELEAPRDVRVALVAVDDERPALRRTRELRANRARQRLELGLQVVDLVGHTAGRVDHERDVELRPRPRRGGELGVRGPVLFDGRGEDGRDPALGQRAAIRKKEVVVAVVVPGAGRQDPGLGAPPPLPAPRVRALAVAAVGTGATIAATIASFGAVLTAVIAPLRIARTRTCT